MPSHVLTFSSTSPDASRVVQLHTTPTTPDDDPADLPADAILIRFLAFPINPQDLMAIAGRYPVKPAHTHGPHAHPIPGNDGVATVLRVGPSATTSLRPGDAVIPKVHGLGTWRSHAVLQGPDIDALLLRVPADVDPVAASLLKMGAAPAYLLLEDMTTLRPGDWIVVNAGGGVIPHFVVQFARLRGCRAVSVVRRGGRSEADFAAVAAALNGGGGGDGVVVSEEALAERGAAAHPELAAAVEAGRIVLALDAVFGESGERIARLLAPDGVYVNYGSLGGADGVVRLSQELLFWRQLRFRNFRLSKQLGLRSAEEQESLLRWFGELLVQGRLKTPDVEVVAWSEDEEVLEGRVKRALDVAVRKPVGAKKQVFVLG